MSAWFDIRVEPSSFDGLRSFVEPAKREKIHLAETPSVKWWRALATWRFLDPVDGVVSEVLAGCIGLLPLKNGALRIGGLFVFPSYRGFEIEDRLNDACLLEAMSVQTKVLETKVSDERNLPWYLKNGFTIIEKKSGVILLKRTLIEASE